MPQRNAENLSALDIAASGGHEKTVQVLMDFNAKYDLKDNNDVRE